MSGLLFAVGAVAVVVGAVMVGFGIPINEFSFGNTLIIAGAVAVVGGLIVVGLGVVVAQLQRIAEALATRTPIRSSRPLDMFDSAAGSRPTPSRIPFPPKPKSDAGIREPFSPAPPATAVPAPAEVPAEESSVQFVAPTLRNPDESPVVEDEVSLSPQHPVAAPVPVDLDEPAQRAPSFDRAESELTEKRHEPTFDAGWRPAPAAPTRQPTNYFDAMWPAETRPAKSAVAAPESKPVEPKCEPPPPPEVAAQATMPAEPEAPAPRQEDEPRAVAILKSGVVDGMGYTLYVDGSIEAELPQGTLRFASINELRSHLEKNA